MIPLRQPSIRRWSFAVGLVLVLAVVIFTTALPTVAAHNATTIGEAERHIDPTEVAPGDSIQVEIDISITQSGDRLTILDLPDPALETVEMADDGFRYNGEAVEPSLSVVESDIVLVGFEPDGGFEADDTLRLVYTATIPETAADEVVEFDGEAAIDDREEVGISGSDQVTVAAADAPSDADGGDSGDEPPADGDSEPGDGPTEDGFQVGTPGFGIPVAILALILSVHIIRSRSR